MKNHKLTEQTKKLIGSQPLNTIEETAKVKGGTALERHLPEVEFADLVGGGFIEREGELEQEVLRLKDCLAIFLKEVKDTVDSHISGLIQSQVALPLLKELQVIQQGIQVDQSLERLRVDISQEDDICLNFKANLARFREFYQVVLSPLSLCQWLAREGFMVATVADLQDLLN